MSVVFSPDISVGLSWYREWSVPVSVAAPVSVLPPPSPAVPSPSPDGVRRRPPLQPSDDGTPPDDVTGAAAAGWLVWSLLECCEAEDNDYNIELDYYRFQVRGDLFFGDIS